MNKWPAEKCKFEMEGKNNNSNSNGKAHPSRMRVSNDFKEELEGALDAGSAEMVSSSTKGSFGFEYDVFLSFRGADIRKGFASNLYEALRERGLRVFMDSEELRKGDRLDEILVAIEASETFVPIFSDNYADSKWCLMEISKMVECGRKIIPVFFNIDPSHVRNQTGPFEAAFRAYTKMKGVSQIRVDHWREVLRKVGAISGYDLKSTTDGNEYKLIQVITKRLLCVIQTPFDIAKYPVGLYSKIDDIMKLLDFEAYDVRMVGIFGITGVGKTTLAKAIYNKISSSFDASCYLLNVREKAELNGIVSLQRKIIRDILNDRDTEIEDINQGISLLKRRMRFKRVLLVLDDVNDDCQLHALAGSVDWFCERSRIIIVTRCMDVLQKLGENDMYEVKELNPNQSVQLFSYHAFGKESPPHQYVGLSKKVVNMAGGLPLAMEVYGSLFFYKRNVTTWESMLKKLEKTQHGKIFHRFKVSFDDLDENEKHIFLDIACFFVGKGKENAIHMWEDSNLCPDLAINVLLGRSLIKVNKEKNEFEMHDQIQSMGKQIVLQEGISEPGRRSRLWDTGQIHDMLQYLDGTRNVESIISTGVGKPNDLLTEAFEAMRNLKILHVNYSSINGDFERFPKKLKWFKWKGCPLTTLPCAFHGGKLVVLELPLSNITQMWPQSGEWKKKAFNSLKVLNLFGCRNLKKIPDFATMPHLEKIVLDRCSSLSKVDESIGHLRTLVFLSLKECEALEKLPNEICKLISLQVLILQGCEKLADLPERIGEMKSLKILDLSMTAIIAIPYSVGNLSNLEMLDCRFCTSLILLPSSLGYASRLKRLYLPSCAELPDSIELLSELEELQVSQCKRIKSLSSSLWQLQNLRHLVINATSITELPQNLGNLLKLQHLDLSGNLDLTVLPDFFDSYINNYLSPRNLPCLKILNLSGSSINRLPSGFRHCLVVLEELCLACTNIVTLLGLPSCLVVLDASFCDALEAIDVSNLTLLKKLHFECCSNLIHVDGLKELEYLESLRMNGCFKLSNHLWNILLKEVSFQHLEKYSVGRRASDETIGSVHLTVEIESSHKVLLKTTRTVYKLDKGFVMRFEVNDEICHFLKGGGRMIRVSMHGYLPDEANLNFHFCNREHFPVIVDDIFLSEMRHDSPFVRRNKATNTGVQVLPTEREKSGSLPAFHRTVASPMSKPVSAPLTKFPIQIPRFISPRTREKLLQPILEAIERFLPSVGGGATSSITASIERQTKRPAYKNQESLSEVSYAPLQNKSAKVISTVTTEAHDEEGLIFQIDI